MKYNVLISVINHCMSLPLVGKWIEIVQVGQFITDAMSLPLVGKWIEIASQPPPYCTHEESLPLVGKWIEIQNTTTVPVSLRSLPLVGKWIEMLDAVAESADGARVFPWWGSGLK